MGEFEKRLKRDADDIRATVSPELRARIDASLHGVQPIRTAKPQSAPVKLWWASSLTGLAAAVMIIAVVNWNRPATETPPTVAENPQPAVTEPPLPVTLDIRTAEFTSPLEEELERLQSDIEKARRSVRDDLDFTF
jgi:hypothetical protein